MGKVDFEAIFSPVGKRAALARRRTFGGYPVDKRVTNSSGKLRDETNLDTAAAKHWILHSRDGSRLQARFPNESVDDLTRHLTEAAGGRLTKRHAQALGEWLDGKRRAVESFGDDEETNKMDILKQLCGLGEHAVTEAVMHYARTQKRAGESDAQAFSRVYTAQDAEGLAIRKVVQISKTFPVAEARKGTARLLPDGVGGRDAFSADRASAARLRALADEQRRRSETDAGDWNERSEDEAEADGAYDKMLDVAKAMQRREPHLTIEKCVEKLYSSGHPSAVAERRQARRRLWAAA